METGTVKWFSDSKGYGFIIRDSDQKEFFVHHSGIISDDYRKGLFEGQAVTFNVDTNDDKGPKAINVTVVK